MSVFHKNIKENPNNGRRYNRLHHLLITLIFSGSLTGCDASAANEEVKNSTPEKDATGQSVEVNTKKFTRTECLALLPDKPKFKACMGILSKQRDVELAAKKKELERLNQTLEALEKIKAATLEQEPNR